MLIFQSCYGSAQTCGQMGFKWVLEHLTLSMASEIFGTAAIFWVLIPIGLAGGALLLKLQGDD
jgi:cytochrome b6-f complex subunit 7